MSTVLRTLRIRCLSTFVVVSVVCGSGTTAHAAELEPTGRALQKFAPAFVARTTYTQADAVDLAEHFDVIIATVHQFREHVGAMHQENGDLRLLVYTNGMFTEAGANHPEGSYSHDRNGDRIRSRRYGTYLMDPASVAWVDTVVSNCSTLVAASGYDGCYIDSLGTAPLVPSWVSALPVNPSTGTEWSGADWLDATSGIAGAVKAALGSIVVVNGLSDGTAYADPMAPTATLLQSVDGAGAELFLRGENRPATWFPLEEQWKAEVDMLVDAEAHGASVFAGVKLWVSATEEQRAQWHKYALASFLLGANGRSYFAFLGDASPEAATAYRPWGRVRLGDPEGSYFQEDGVYKRTFRRGVVLVNPTTASATVRLHGRYKDLDGLVRRRMTMPPNTGEVLRRL